VTEFRNSSGANNNIAESDLSLRQAKLLEVVGNGEALIQGVRAALQGLWESGRDIGGKSSPRFRLVILLIVSNTGGKGAKEALLNRLRDWAKSNYAQVFMDILTMALKRSYMETQTLVHFIATAHQHAPTSPTILTNRQNDLATARKSNNAAKVKKSTTGITGVGQVHGTQVDILAGVLRKREAQPAARHGGGRREGFLNGHGMGRE